MKPSGLVWSSQRHGFMWGWKHRWLLRWPQWTKRPIIRIVNFLCCCWWGHDRVLEHIRETHAPDGSFHCVMCCKKLWPKEKGMPEELCHCGKPLHYQSAASEKLVRQLVADHGPMVRVTVGDRTWLVQRHYIALHGINAWELPDLGFEEIQREVAG